VLETLAKAEGMMADALTQVRQESRASPASLGLQDLLDLLETLVNNVVDIDYTHKDD
jgi:hypothetical protein